MPLDDSLGFDDHQHRAPILPHARENDPKEAVATAKLRSVDSEMIDGQLLAQREVLGGELGPAHEQTTHQPKDRLEGKHDV